jgi:hyperosmotically inducible periplasmic protein
MEGQTNKIVGRTHATPRGSKKNAPNKRSNQRHFPCSNPANTNSIEGIVMNSSRTFLLKTINTQFVGLLSLCTLTLLAACNRTDVQESAGQKLDRVVASTEKAAADAEIAAKTSAQSVEASIRESTANVKAAAKSASADMGKSVADAAIATSVSADLIKDPDLSAIKIDVDARDGVVRLYGPAPSEAARSRATDIAKSVKGVVSVENLLVIKQ